MARDLLIFIRRGYCVDQDELWHSRLAIAVLNAFAPRLILAALFTLPLVVTNVFAKPLDVTDIALVNHPLVESLRGRVDGDGMLLGVTLRFVNKSAADAGAEVLVFDLPATKPQIKTRVIFFRQVPEPNGIPDIFQPVGAHFIVNLASLPKSSQIVAFNYALPEGEHFGARTVLVRRAQELADQNLKPVEAKLPVTDGLHSLAVPRIKRPDVEITRSQRSRLAKITGMTAENVRTPPPDHATVFRQAPRDEESPEIIYLLITARAAAHGPKVESTTQEFEFQWELSPSRALRLVVLNPVDGEEQVGELPFVSREIPLR